MFPRNYAQQSLFNVSECVWISGDPFAAFNVGVIEEIGDARSRMKIAVSIFKRPKAVKVVKLFT
jgi:transcription termination/antitermination protein NusG